MFYEEKIINGILMCRTKPDGAWRQCSIEEMGERIITLEGKITRLQTAIDTAKELGENSESPFYKMMALLNENSSGLKDI